MDDNLPINSSYRARTNELDLKEQYERKIVVKLDRADLEDKYLKLHEENIDLKKNSLRQEDKIKRLGTKLLRLVNDKKNQDNAILTRKQDVDLEEIIQDLQDQNRELTKQNKAIKEKLIATKQQLATRSKPSLYQHVPARINSGKNKRSSSANRASPSGAFREHRRIGTSSPLPKYGLSLLEEARAENKDLEAIIQALQEKLNIMEQVNDSLKEEINIKEIDCKDAIADLRAQMTSGQKKHVQGNVEMIRLQRELKAKSSLFENMDQERKDAVQKMDVLKTSNEQLIADVESLNLQIEKIQSKNLQYESQFKLKSAVERNLQQVQEQLNDVQHENNVLKDVNEKLMNSSMNVKPSRDNSAVEQVLRAQIAQLQDMINTKENISMPSVPVFEQIKYVEKETDDGLQRDYEDLKNKYSTVMDDNREMKEKLNILSESSLVNVADFENALSMVKMDRERGRRPSAVDDAALQKQVSMLETQNVETVNELEKTRNMLILQHRINKDYQAEVEAITEHKNQQVTEYETRLQEYAKLLDIRAARIQKLEKQLKDIAYGTKQYQITDTINDYDMEETVPLERGQNLFELHIDKVTMTADCLHFLQDKNPQTFVTYAFYDYQLVASDLRSGSRPDFNHTSRFIIRADDTFLEYILKMKTKVDLHAATGLDYVTIATGCIDFRPILDDTQSRYHGKLQLIGKNEMQDDVVMATLEYWARLKIPMEQAVRLFKERGKALGYIATNYKTTKSALTILESHNEQQSTPANSNQVHVTIIRCTDITTAHGDAQQPSAYCMYVLDDKPQHITPTIPASNNPQFNDHHIIDFVINHQIDDYFKTKSLQIYLFDDADPAVNTYIGVADIPLVPLVNNRPIKGTFQIVSENGDVCGNMDVSIYLQHTYLPPIHTTIHAASSSSPEHQPEIPDKNEPKGSQVLSDTILAGHANVVPHPTPSPRVKSSGPTASSTPVKSAPLSNNIQKLSSNNSEAESHEKMKPEAAPRRTSLKFKDLESKDPGLLSDAGSGATSRRSSLQSQSASSSPQKSSPKKAAKTPDELSDDDSVDSMKEELKAELEVKSPVREEYNNENKFSKKESMSTSESEDVVVKVPATNLQQSSDTIRIVIHHLSVNAEASIINNDDIQMLFVEYKFLNYCGEELETPFALPKPAPGHKISFHFNKVFHVDAKENYSKRQLLAAMLLPSNSDLIKLTVVSEPPDDKQNEVDCEDVGFATVSLNHILTSGDYIEHDIPVFDHDGTTEIGHLNVTVEAAQVLKAIQSEMNISS